jgi:hypothetical protein
LEYACPQFIGGPPTNRLAAEITLVFPLLGVCHQATVEGKGTMAFTIYVVLKKNIAALSFETQDRLYNLLRRPLPYDKCQGENGGDRVFPLVGVCHQPTVNFHYLMFATNQPKKSRRDLT